ncbi:hypothetical protein [Corynebacterium glaucum]|uniref:hypothetical protein n=1 Tax=Corynebacterium glaucum TaxID=187491 RepID=UPI00265976A5|nr:hypothetical protein [Corynebacterium glaucum]
MLSANAVIFAGDTVDPSAPKVVRSTASSLFHIPVARDREVRRVIGQLEGAGLAGLRGVGRSYRASVHSHPR